MNKEYTYPDDNIFRGSKDPVQDGSGKGSVETVCWSQAGEQRVGHSLRDDDQTNSDA